MNKEQIQNTLRTIVHSAKLPKQIDFEISNNCLLMKVSETGVIANMQEDKSAFEGWAIVLKAALPEIEKVVLDWDNPKYNPENENAQKAHYNRFLMRAANFRKGYSWFDIAEERKGAVDTVQNLLDNKILVVNFPKSPCNPDVNKEQKPEAFLERKLVKLWSNSQSIIDEQLPVGLFNSTVCIANTFTPRGASQIDLWQLKGDTMHIYELKVKGNESIGIISELMFYVCTILHIVNGVINYPDLSKEKPFRHFIDFATAVKNKKIHNVVGYFTAPKFHPLIESAQLKNIIKNILNENTFGIRFEYKDISNLI
ncbi:MAG: hypothetical protein K2I94_04925 [Muribaculaceae bacterium]|nr:hypothetical protein [Muribaculaceae bacterium]